jgi:hypothetical protein
MGASRRSDSEKFDVKTFMVNFNLERDARAAAAGMPRNLDRSDSRDLTDDELRILGKSYNDGVETLRTHRWNGKKDET